MSSQLNDTLRACGAHLQAFSLPKWEEIPDLGLYMEQVILLMRQYAQPLPGGGDEAPVTAAAINNYVRTKVMPKPNKKKYYRIHIAYLIMICALKQGINIAVIGNMLPLDLGENEVRDFYGEFARRYQVAARIFSEKVEEMLLPVLDDDSAGVNDVICLFAVVSAFSRQLSEKLLKIMPQPAESERDE